jgi:hypothetical protein
MRCSGHLREHTRGTGCAHGLSGGRLIRARITCDACGFSIIRLVVASEAMCARDFWGIVIPCKLSGQARFAFALACRFLPLSVVAVQTDSGSRQRVLSRKTGRIARRRSGGRRYSRIPSRVTLRA